MLTPAQLKRLLYDDYKKQVLKNYLIVFERINKFNREEFHREVFYDKLLKSGNKFKSLSYFEDDGFDIDTGSYEISPKTLKVSKYTSHMMKIDPKVGL